MEFCLVTPLLASIIIISERNSRAQESVRLDYGFTAQPGPPQVILAVEEA